MQNKLIVISIFLYSIALRLIILFVSNPVIDDFYITLRVAKNFILGNGLVYNTGEKIISSTSNLYAIFCALFIYLFDDNAILILRIVLAVFDSMTVLLIFLLLFHFLKSISNNNASLNTIRLFSITGSLIYSSYPSVISANLRGLETSIYIFFIALSFYLLQEEKYKFGFIFACIAAIIRPDGLLLVLTLFILYIFLKRKIAFVIPGVVLYLFYQFLTYLEFNTIIPQSVIAKSYISKNFFEQWGVLLNKFFLDPKSILLGCFAILGMIISFNFNRILPLLIWGILYTVSFSSLGYWYPWYMSPFIMFYSTMFIIGIFYVTNQLNNFKTIIKSAQYLLLLIPILLLFQTIHNEVFLGKNDSLIELSQKKKVASFLNNIADDKEVISIEPLGIIGYYCFEKHFIDYPGLISKDVTNIWGKNNIVLVPNFTDTTALKLFINKIEPHYLLLRKFEYEFLRSTRILNSYNLISIFMIDSTITKIRHNSDFLDWYIYRKL